MIEVSLLKTRTRDSVKVYVRHSIAYFNKTTHKFVSEIPEGESENDYQMTFCGYVKQDQTGLLYEIAQDVENTPYTYTEVFPDPADACEWNTYSPNFNVYPNYNATTTYSEGDKVVYEQKTYVSDFNNNLGNTPSLYGWSEYLPRVEKVTPTYKTLAELYPEQEGGGE